MYCMRIIKILLIEMCIIQLFVPRPTSACKHSALSADFSNHRSLQMKKSLTYTITNTILTFVSNVEGYDMSDIKENGDD